MKLLLSIILVALFTSAAAQRTDSVAESQARLAAEQQRAREIRVAQDQRIRELREAQLRSMRAAHEAAMRTRPK